MGTWKERRVAVRNMAVWMTMLVIGPAVWCTIGLVPNRRARWRLVRMAGRILCVVAGVRVQVQGDPHDGARPFVVVANHDSFIDAMTIILTLREPVVFVAGSALHNQRIAGPFLRRLGCLFVGGRTAERTDAFLARLAAELDAGRSLAIFPEGSLAHEPGLRRFRSGAFVVAAMANRPVLPMALTGTRAIVPPGSRKAHRGTISVAIGSPIQPSGHDHAAAVDLRAASKAMIEALLAPSLANRAGGRLSEPGAADR